MEDEGSLRYRRCMSYVYILECSDGSFYVGLTQRDHLDERIGEHQSGVFGGYTSLRRPVKLVWAQHFPMIVDAIAFERQVKRWSRAKKEALIRGAWSAVQSLARRRGGQALK